MELIRQEPGVVGVTGSVLGPVLAETRSRISTPRIKGWDEATASSVIPLRGVFGGGQLVAGSRAGRGGFGVGPSRTGLSWARK